MKNRYLIIAMAIAPFTFVGCNGGGSSGGVNSSSVSPTGVVYGRIDGFGSIHVDNRRLLTDDNTVVIIGDDNPVIWDDKMIDDSVRAGQVAMVRADNGHADLITIDESVKGPVDSSSPLVVMGQTVIQGAGTLVDNSCSDLSTAEVVEVHGLVNVNGEIEANVIECKTKAAVNHYSVIGNVANLGSTTFDINGLTVDFTNAVIDDSLAGGLQNGMLVQVKDSQKLYVAGSGTLFATKVEPQLSLGDLASSDEDMEVKSIVTDISGLPGSFKMGDLTVNISASTTFLFGDASLIVNGVEIEAEGHTNSSGELNADKIKFEDGHSRIDAFVTSVAGDTITLLDGAVTVVTDASTQFNGVTLPVTAGDSIEVRGFLGTNGNFVASEVKDGSNDSSRPEIRSTATNLDAAAGTMEILGITIVTDASTEFKGHDESPMTKDAFFAAVVADVTTVQAKWRDYTNDLSIPVKELELEDD